MSIKAVLSGASIKIIPNGWRDRDGGVSKFNLARLGPRYLLTILYCLLERYIRHAGARVRKSTHALASASPREGSQRTQLDL